MKEIKIKDLKQFGYFVSGLLLVIAAVNFFRHGSQSYIYLVSTSAVFFAVTVFKPLFLKPVYKGFLKVAHAIGWVNTRILLAAAFYMLLTPTGLLMRLFGKDVLCRKIDKGAKSYWIKREKSFAAKEGLENQF